MDLRPSQKATIESIETYVEAINDYLEGLEQEISFPSDVDVDDIAAAGDQQTTERTITVTLPSGATIRRVMLTAFVHIDNDTATLHKVDVTVQGRKGAGAWSDLVGAISDCLMVPAVEGTNDGYPFTVDVSALVDEAASYGFRLTVNQSGGANSVHYTTEYLLKVTYRMG